ncbi:MAG: outer membrane protein assembly factor BamB family protein [Planctomycetota bacterium]
MGVAEGYCLMLGVGDGRLAGELARRSDLSICCLEPDEAKIAKARRFLDDAGLYGVRVSVQHGSYRRLPYADYFANLVVLDESLAGDIGSCSAGELYRVLHPYDGVACIATGRSDAATVTKWLLDAGVPAKEISAGDGTVRVVRGEPPGAGSWTHQYADAGRSGASTDTIARLPLRTLWFGGPGPARMVSRHFRGPPPLFSRGRMFVAGEHHLIAVDAYNGREIWSRELPGVGRYSSAWRGGSIAADTEHVYALKGLECLQLAAATGRTLRTHRVPVKQEIIDKIAEDAASELRAARERDLSPPRLVVWEFLAVTKGLVLGSVGAPNERRKFRYDAFPEGRFVFALDKKSGRVRWVHAADEAVDPNAIAVSDQQARVFLIDRTLTAGFVRERRRGARVEVRTCLKALDLATGEVVWKTRELEENRRSLWMKGEVLIALPLPERSWAVNRNKGPGGASAFSTRDGKRLWTKPDTFNRDGGYSRTPVLTSDIAYFDRAYDLRTGKPVLHANPVSGIPEPFEANAKHLCGTYSGSENLLMFRCGSLAFVDFRRDLGTQWHPEVRPGCWINMIVGGGMVLVPEGTSSCTCGYSYKTSLALVPTERHENWSVYLKRRKSDSKAPVRYVRANFGAVGDQRDGRGVLWMGFPRPTRWDNRKRVMRPARYVLKLPLEAGEGPRYHRKNADEWPITGTDAPWLYTSGCEGPLELKIDLRTPPADGAQRCRMVLHFAEIEGAGPGRRVFDVSLDGKTLVSSLDVVKEAGGRNVALVKDLGEVRLARKTTLRLVPREDSARPVISALEIVRLGHPGGKRRNAPE